MKRILTITTACMLLVSMIFPATAQEQQTKSGATCTIIADSAAGNPGETVTVSVRMENCPGFTNFGIALDYDREKLEPVSIQTENETKNPYLCGSSAGTNTAWAPGEDTNAAENTAFSQEQSYVYVVCALAEAETESGELFTVTFRLKEDFAGEAAVTPMVNYLRSQSETPGIFEDLQVQTAGGTIGLNTESQITTGDVNEDGFITADDAATVFAASKDSTKLTQAQKTAADVNEDGFITADDAAMIFAMSKSVQ